MNPLFTPLTLPNGTILKNRLAKAAMEENLCDYGQLPGKKLETLYARWARGGVGLIITGNVMIAPDALTGPGGVVLENDNNLERFKKWAAAGRQNGTHLWMQINHPGRQMFANLEEQAVSASDHKVSIPGFDKMLAQPRALKGPEVEMLIQRFATTAKLAEQAGFTGVQIHGAHGYLINQFLSPLTNDRIDEWGGSLENRAKFLLDTIKAVRTAVSATFCVSVKLNSADFQKGGFDLDDAKWVVEQINHLGVDLIEISGGSYESPAMQGRITDGTSTLKREAYFIDFARDIATVAEMPVMVTGGITRRTVAEDALVHDHAGFGVQMLGIARAMAYNPDLPNDWQEERALETVVPEVQWKKKALASLAVMSLTKAQLERMATGRDPKADMSPILALIADQYRTRKRAQRYRKWRDKH